jgi:branched-subunit amino acid ABC-type transport system permease component
MSIIIAAVGFGLITASILAIAAVGFTLQFGVTNIINIAYGDVMTLCGFAAYVINRQGVNIWIALIGAAIVGAAISVALNRFLYAGFVRRGTSSVGMIIVSLSVAVIIGNLILAGFGPTFFTYRMSAGSSYHFAGMVFTAAQLAIMGIAAASMIGVHVILTRTKLGKAMRAVSSDAGLARSCGIAASRVVDIAWALSGALCGIAGVVLMINVTSFQASTGNSFLVVIVAAAIFGGVGQPYGAMLGALVLGISTEVLAAVFDPGYKDVFALAVLVIVLLIRPQGVISEVAVQREVVA